MARGGFPGGRGGRGMGGGMPNMNQLLKQAQKMQADLVKTQEELQNKEYSATVGGGAVSVVASGNKTIKTLEIQPDVVDPDDVEMLQDLIISAVNEVLSKIEEDSSNEMGKLTGGMGGMSGLF